MSVKELLGGNPAQILKAQSLIRETAKKEEGFGRHKSHTYIVASTFISEGQKELREISEKLTRSGIQIDPRSTTSIFHQLPPSERRGGNLAYAAVAFGTIMISLDKLVEEQVFNPREMVSLFNYSVNGTFIPKWDTNNSREAVALSKQEHRKLLEVKGEDSSLSIILTKHLDKIPEEIRRVIDNTGLIPFAEKILISPFRLQVQKLDRENPARRKDIFLR